MKYSMEQEESKFTGSIRRKIIAGILSIAVTAALLLGILGSILNYLSAMNTLEKSMTETALITSERISAVLQSYSNIAFEAGCNAKFSDPAVSAEEKKTIIDQRVAAYGLERGNIIGLDGKSIFDGTDFSDREYVQASLRGEAAVSDPLISKVTGKLSIIISAPIWEKGVPNSKVAGVIYFVPNEDFLINIVKTINVGETGSAYLLNAEGLTIAHRDASIVGVENTIRDSQTDPSLLKIAEIEKRMIAGEQGFAQYVYGGVRKIEAFAPIANTNGWSVGVTAEQQEFLSGFRISMLTTIGVMAMVILVGIIFSIILGNRLSNPIQLCAKRLVQLADGDLKTPVPEVSANDETGILADAALKVVGNLREVVEDIRQVLERLSTGELNVSSSAQYQGDFIPIRQAIGVISDSLNLAMTNINISSDQVSVGAEQVSSGAQALSQGTTEQASAVEELASTIQDVASHIKKNAESSNDASATAEQVGAAIRESNSEMQKLIGAMQEINDKSGQIGAIIKTIEDISFQTNILALNAAVEAARAGAAGKGFAVVADEVRNLANKSAEAAKNTTALIEDSIHAIQNGTRLADQTAQSLMKVVENAEDVVVKIDGISKASNEQAQAIGEISIGIDQISTVVQTNSATAVESAAASEELSGQARMLKDLVGKFHLRDGGESFIPEPMPPEPSNYSSDKSFSDKY